MGNNSFVRPQLTLLDQEQKALTHRYALDVLSQTGVRVDSAEVRKLLASWLGASMVKDDIVRFPPELVEWAIRAAPKSIAIFNRLGDLAFNLGADRHRFGMGVTSLAATPAALAEGLALARSYRDTVCSSFGNKL